MVMNRKTLKKLLLLFQVTVYKSCWYLLPVVGLSIVLFSFFYCFAHMFPYTAKLSSCVGYNGYSNWHQISPHNIHV